MTLPAGKLFCCMSALATVATVGGNASASVLQKAIDPAPSFSPPEAPPPTAPNVERAAARSNPFSTGPGHLSPVVVRYACIFVMSKARLADREHVVDRNSDRSRLFRELFRQGTDMPLDADGRAFLRHLRLTYPEYLFFVSFVGDAVPAADGSVQIERHEFVPADDCEVAVKYNGRLEIVRLKTGESVVKITGISGAQRWHGNNAPGGGFGGGIPIRSLSRTYASCQTGGGSTADGKLWMGSQFLVMCVLPRENVPTSSPVRDSYRR